MATVFTIIALVLIAGAFLNDELRYRGARERINQAWQRRIDADRDRLAREKMEALEMVDACHEQLAWWSSTRLDEEYALDFALKMLRAAESDALDPERTVTEEQRTNLAAMIGASARFIEAVRNAEAPTRPDLDDDIESGA